MIGAVGYALGFDNGVDAARAAADRDAAIEAVFGGARPVQVLVNQSYMDQLHAALSRKSQLSDHNYKQAVAWQGQSEFFEGKARSFREEALHWRDDADAQRAALAEEREAHQKTRDVARGFEMFHSLANILLRAEAFGKADRPAFAELRSVALSISHRMKRGEVVLGYDEAEAERIGNLVGELV